MDTWPADLQAQIDAAQQELDDAFEAGVGVGSVEHARLLGVLCSLRVHKERADRIARAGTSGPHR